MRVFLDKDAAITINSNDKEFNKGTNIQYHTDGRSYVKADVVDLSTGEVFEGGSKVSANDTFNFEVGKDLSKQRALIDRAKSNVEWLRYLKDVLINKLSLVNQEIEQYENEINGRQEKLETLLYNESIDNN